MRFVHVNCLNRWRSMSINPRCACTVLLMFIIPTDSHIAFTCYGCKCRPSKVLTTRISHRTLRCVFAADRVAGPAFQSLRAGVAAWTWRVGQEPPPVRRLRLCIPHPPQPAGPGLRRLQGAAAACARDHPRSPCRDPSACSARLTSWASACCARRGTWRARPSLQP